MRPRELFRNRVDAGRQLALCLGAYRDEAPLVLGLPRGGMVVAYEVARELRAPLDVCVVRKIGAPIEPELAIGAVAEEEALWFDRDTMDALDVTDEALAELAAVKWAEVEESVYRYRKGAPPLDVRGKTVIVVDDGIATGATARAALSTLRVRGAGRIVLAVPVASADSLDELEREADEIVCPYPKDRFLAVGAWYEDFSSATDDDVIELLDRARAERVQPEDERPKPRSPSQSERVRAPLDRDVTLALGHTWLEGRLTVPEGARGLIIFAHGSGSSRHSPRNKYVAAELQREGFGTLLLDLLTEEEERVDAVTMHLRFDIEFLASRLGAATDWVRTQADTKALAIGYVGASTGAAAALVSAAERPKIVQAVVSRGGRPDLAAGALGRVRAPTLLIVGSEDNAVLELNREALAFFDCEARLEVVPGATHLFEEPAALSRVARLAAGWFTGHLRGRAIEATA